MSSVKMLTSRQLIILRWLRAGVKQHEVATQLGVARHSVEAIVRKVRAHYGVSKTAELFTISVINEQLDRPDDVVHGLTATCICGHTPGIHDYGQYGDRIAGCSACACVRPRDEARLYVVSDEVLDLAAQAYHADRIQRGLCSDEWHDWTADREGLRWMLQVTLAHVRTMSDDVAR